MDNINKKLDNLKISFVSHSSDKGGAERAMLDMIDVLLKNNIFVHVILPGEGPLEEELINRDIVYDKVDIKWWANVESDSDSIRKIIDNNAVGLAAIFNKIKPDIIYTISSVISEGAIAAKILGIPHIWNIAEFGRAEHGIKYLLPEDKRMQFISDYSDKIFFVSEAIKKYYTDRINIEDKSFIFPPIVSNIADKDSKNNQNEYFKKDVFRMAILGNIVEGKGQKDAISAVCEILKENNNIELVIAGSTGDEKYYNELEKIIASNGAQDNINFIGYIDNPNQLIKQADIILVCSVFEGFGRVTVEAMMHKKPVIGANSGATSELIKDKINGFLYEPGDFKKLAEKIRFFMDDKAKVVEFGENGYNFAKEKFDENIYTERLLGELNSLRGKKREVSNDILDKLFEAVIFNNEKNQKLKEDLRQKDEQLANIVNSLRWKIPNYLYKKYRNIFKR